MKASSEPAAEIQLPEPTTTGTMSVSEALARRRSVRSFAAEALTRRELSQLCWAAQGITDDAGNRAAPSAGALFPITLLVVDGEGVYEYLPDAHALRSRYTGDWRVALQVAALEQSCVGSAAVCLIIAADEAKLAQKYGDRSRRYCFLEAGHVAQNVLLQATALGLAGVPVGAFADRKIAAWLKLPQNERPVYLVPVGRPAGS